MPFTVIHRGGGTDFEFLRYTRRLRQRGLDIGKLPRVRDPITDRRWLPAWDDRAAAQAFADELNELQTDPLWEVAEAETPACEGPLGPIVIQMVRETDGLTFGLHALTEAIIRSAYPDAVSALTFAIIRPENWEEYRRSKGELGHLVREIAPNLTGLNEAQLETLGYAVVDWNTEQTVVSVPPAQMVQV